jgi:hypothetical protein
MKQYGIKVPFEDVWLWVTSGTPYSETLELKVMLFDRIEDAQKVADKFGPLAMVKEYDV